MSRTEILAAMESACMPNTSYKIEVLGKYVQASYGLEWADVKSAILALLHSGEFELTDNLEITKVSKGKTHGQSSV